MGEFLDYFKTKKNLTSLLLLGIIILGLPIGIQLLKQQQILKSRATESSDPIRFIASDTEFQQSAGNNSTWATTDPNISFNLYSPFGSPGTTAGTPTPTPSPTPGGSAVPTATPVPTSTPPSSVPFDRITIPLEAGWNMISFPRTLIDSSINMVFSGYATEVYSYNTSAEGSWVIAKWSNGSWGGLLKNVEPGKGYWINAQGSQDLVVDVSKNTSGDQKLAVTEGWNLIGYTQTAASMGLQAYLMSVGIPDTRWTKIYTWKNGAWDTASKSGTDSGTATSGTLKNFEIGRGYWILVGSGINSGEVAPPPSPEGN